MGLASEFHSLFLGLERAYGTYNISKASGSVKVKGKARTVSQPVTDDIWANHLSGKQGLGIVPINDDNNCNWAAIDIDIYDLDYNSIEEQIKEHGLPLIPCTTKSGGLHLYLFLSTPVPGLQVRKKMKEWAEVLGQGDAEIFPKQNELRDGVGNWINMPYFDANGENKRHALKNGKPLSASEFLNLAKKLSVSKSQLNKVKVKTNSLLDGAPPCIKTLWIAGIPSGNRDKGLLSVSVYLKRKYPDDWEDKLRDFNKDHVNPPLPAKQVTKIVGSLGKKEYSYMCNDLPLSKHCNKDDCAKEEFGVGNQGPGAEFTNLICMETAAGELITWKVNVNGFQIKVATTDELSNIRAMRSLCIEKLKITLNGCKDAVWNDVLRDLLITCDTQIAPDDASDMGQFVSLLGEFVDMGLGRNKESLLDGRAYKEEGLYMFNSGSLITFLKGRKFQIKTSDMWSTIKDRLDGSKRRFKLKGKQVRVWCIPVDKIDVQTDEFDEIDVTGGM